MSEPMAQPTRVQHGVTIETVTLPAEGGLRGHCADAIRAAAMAAPLDADQLAAVAEALGTTASDVLKAASQQHVATVAPATVGSQIQPSDIEGTLAPDIGEHDPYTDACPVWCGGIHRATPHEEERSHYGLALFMPVRSLQAHYYERRGDQTAFVGFSDVCMSLEQPALYRDPHIRFSTPGDSPVLTFSVHEASQIAACLTRLVEEAQR